MGSQQFCLKWNNHQTNMLIVFEQLLSSEALVDVTLACEGLSLKAHKMVLSACSPFFQSLFLENPCKHPIVILKDMKYTDLKAIVDFMYRGEVNVSQDQLSALLKTAETLKVKGLAEVTGEQRQGASGVVQEIVPQSSSSQALTPSGTQLHSAESPTVSRRKRGRHRRRSHSDSNCSDTEDQVPSKIKEPDSPEIVEEISRDTSESSEVRQRLAVPNHPQNQVAIPHPSVLSGSSRKSISSVQDSHVTVEEPPSGDETEFEMEPSKLMEQSMSDTVPVYSDDPSQGPTLPPVSSQLSISNTVGMVDTQPHHAAPGPCGDSQALVPSSMPSEPSTSSHIPQDTTQDIKPLVSYEEPPISPVAGPSHQDSNSMMMYMDTSVSSLPGPSNYQVDTQQSQPQTQQSQPQDVFFAPEKRRQFSGGQNQLGKGSIHRRPQIVLSDISQYYKGSKKRSESATQEKARQLREHYKHLRAAKALLELSYSAQNYVDQGHVCTDEKQPDEFRTPEKKSGLEEKYDSDREETHTPLQENILRIISSLEKESQIVFGDDESTDGNYSPKLKKTLFEEKGNLQPINTAQEKSAQQEDKGSTGYFRIPEVPEPKRSPLEAAPLLHPNPVALRQPSPITEDDAHEMPTLISVSESTSPLRSTLTNVSPSTPISPPHIGKEKSEVISTPQPLKPGALGDKEKIFYIPLSQLKLDTLGGKGKVAYIPLSQAKPDSAGGKESVAYIPIRQAAGDKEKKSYIPVPQLKLGGAGGDKEQMIFIPLPQMKPGALGEKERQAFIPVSPLKESEAGDTSAGKQVASTSQLRRLLLGEEPDLASTVPAESTPLPSSQGTEIPLPQKEPSISEDKKELSTLATKKSASKDVKQKDASHASPRKEIAHEDVEKLSTPPTSPRKEIIHDVRKELSIICTFPEGKNVPGESSGMDSSPGSSSVHLDTGDLYSPEESAYGDADADDVDYTPEKENVAKTKKKKGNAQSTTQGRKSTPKAGKKDVNGVSVSLRKKGAAGAKKVNGVETSKKTRSGDKKSSVSKMQTPVSKASEVDGQSPPLKRRLFEETPEKHEARRSNRIKRKGLSVSPFVTIPWTGDKHSHSAPGERPAFKCTTCQKVYFEKGDLTKHMRTHRKPPYQCSYCNKLFTQKCNYDGHMRVHTGERPYLCSYCGKSFSQHSNLVNHILVHTGERPHKCHLCNKSFTQKVGLVKHILVHTGERSHVCGICGKAFAQKSTLVRHNLIHVGEGPHECPKCGKVYVHRYTLKSHLRFHLKQEQQEQQQRQK